ncbi:NAD-dependent epimerase/dehydratase family protein [Helicobacter monodelphidis]|uniref:NAD-dependent epimerase/dehydratase family protein n=1 Tax=Helicobacter sp. 15-1451 TaxID=2004995 RepID=UPI000DD3EF54|nr:NAD-dependent epimerase/dehydratase family protein [Helicobacter sp. 15-1451]
MVLIVGGAGYVGSHLHALLCTRREDVLVLDNLVCRHKESLTLEPIHQEMNEECRRLQHHSHFI